MIFLIGLMLLIIMIEITTIEVRLKRKMDNDKKIIEQLDQVVQELRRLN